MLTVEQKENESRANYLVRVAVAVLEENGYNIRDVHYDGAVCDALCLADELRTEFDIE